jgi:outer membrane protein OmpA-like peptidoglycan-associated protein
VAPRYLFTATPRVFTDIEFEAGHWKIRSTSFPILDEIAASLEAQPSIRVRVEGHTDARGSDHANLILSQQRALAIVNYLVAAGIDPASTTPATARRGPSRRTTPTRTVTRTAASSFACSRNRAIASTRRRSRPSLVGTSRRATLTP